MLTYARSGIDLLQFMRPGDHVLWGHACGEPLTLIEALVEQRAALAPISAFVPTSFSGALHPEHADHIAFSSMGAMGALRTLARAQKLAVIPCHFGQLQRMIEEEQIGCDVVFVQVSPLNSEGQHSYGVVNDYLQSAIARARVVVAEVNDQVPVTACDQYLSPERITCTVETSRPVLEIKGNPLSEVDRAIARHAAQFIEDGAVLQVGIGSVPDAILRLLGDRRDLGVHSGIVGDGLVDLVHSGVVTNARKLFDVGVSIAGSLMGSKRLFDFAHRNPQLRLHASKYTHDQSRLAAIPRLVTINSALEVDLTGQVNSEQVGELYMGGTGGQVDFVRGGNRSPGGRSLIALPSTANESSRICMQLSGPVTTSRSEVDVIVTEYGAVQLKGCSMGERAKRLMNIAHPRFREGLARVAYDIAARGY